MAMRKDAAGQLRCGDRVWVLSCFGTCLEISKTRWQCYCTSLASCAVMVQYVPKRSRFRWIALAGRAVLSACNDTRDLAPPTPTNPWQYPLSPEVAVPATTEHCGTISVARRH